MGTWRRIWLVECVSDLESPLCYKAEGTLLPTPSTTTGASPVEARVQNVSDAACVTS